MHWPEYFPPDCPPNDAKEPHDRVYRLIQQDAATADDFLTVRQLYPNRQFPDSEKECRSCALSVLLQEMMSRLTAELVGLKI
ncbi:MAG: hypothetical protein HC894_16570 [Microcoleus sp. SM1_3_4]|nr:hypothetical protein [Microcoleus sp. SM1_3_4]